MKSFMVGTINEARFIDSNGKEIPIPSPRMVSFNTSRSAGADKSYSFPTEPVGMKWEVPLTDEMKAFFDALLPAEPNSAFKLDAETGRVLVDGRRVSVNGERLPAQWYYINVVDLRVWRYALETGLQLEDAVRELNWRAEKQEGGNA